MSDEVKRLPPSRGYCRVQYFGSRLLRGKYREQMIHEIVYYDTTPDIILTELQTVTDWTKKMGGFYLAVKGRRHGWSFERVECYWANVGAALPGTKQWTFTVD